MTLSPFSVFAELLFDQDETERYNSCIVYITDNWDEVRDEINRTDNIQK